MLKKKLTKGLIGLSALIALSAISLFSLSEQFCADKDIQPQIHYNVQDRYLQKFSSPFSPLNSAERETKWGSEYLIGLSFARNLDFYRAITALRRAEILIPNKEEERKHEIQYAIILSYYLGQRYKEIEQAFDQSDLSNVSMDFPAFQNLLIILYDTYFQLGETEKYSHILSMIEEHLPNTHQNLVHYSALSKANFPILEKMKHPLLKVYEKEKKSPPLAILLNAILPGAGYFYLGQLQTALTALFMNGLFILAAIYFFKRRPIVAAIIFLSFEMGWYFGGISGASSQAKLYNEHIYEQIATPMMNRQGIFPIYQLKHAY